MTDFLALGIEAIARSDWLRRAVLAPIPPAQPRPASTVPPPRHGYSDAESDSWLAANGWRRTRDGWASRDGAIIPSPLPPSVRMFGYDRYLASEGSAPWYVALDDGRHAYFRTSLAAQQWAEGNAAMAVVALSQKPQAAANGRVQCAVCGLSLDRALPSYPVCCSCGDDVATTRARLERRVASARTKAQDAHAECQAARDALPPSDTPRWDKIAAVRAACERVGRHANTATAEQQAWLGRVRDAILDLKSAKVSDAIRCVWYADEIAYWTVAGAVEEERRAKVASVIFEAFVSAKIGAELAD